MLATQERGGRDRKVRPVQGFERREVVFAELEDPLRRAQVLEPVLTEVTEPAGVDERGRRRRDEHLSAVASSCDPRRTMNVRTDVSIVGQQRRTGVEAHAHRHLELLLRLARGLDRSGCCRERDEEGVALRVDLDAAVPVECLAQHVAMLGETARVVLGTEVVQ